MQNQTFHHTVSLSYPADTQPFLVHWPEMPLRINAAKPLSNVSEKKRIHYHDCLEIGCCFTGNGIYYIRNEIYPFGKGDIAVVYAGEPHDGCSITPQSSIWRFVFADTAVLFADMPDREHLLELSDALRHRGHLCCMPERSRVQPLLYRIFELADEAGGVPADLSYITLLLAGILYETERYLPEVASPSTEISAEMHRITAPALAYMMNHYASPIRMEDLSALCYVSEGHLRRVFTAVFGLPPMEFLHKIRIRHACAALAGTDCSVLSIAGQCGYTSLSSFNRQFRHNMQMTPSEYRQAYRKNAQ